MAGKKHFTLPDQQDYRFRYPYRGVKETIRSIYKKNDVVLGLQRGGAGSRRVGAFRKNTVAIVGIALGDEGKGRFVDNKIADLFKKRGVKKVAAVRYQGGNNAGHTVEGKGVRLALHLVPSCVMHERAFGIMDRGMIIHVEDLQTEVSYIEERLGSLAGRLFLSDEAILATDLERAEEVLNGLKTGKARGGTGRGIAPSYAHNLDRLGLKVSDILQRNWKDVLGNQYNRYQKEFASFSLELADVEVPNYSATQKLGRETARKVGTKRQFLNRLEQAVSWLKKQDMVTNTFLLHHAMFKDESVGIVFEGAQAAGLDAWLGTRPDVTSSNTTVFGIREGTGYWLPHMVEEHIGLMKIPYTSSVGVRRVPTQSTDQRWIAFVREKANEYGTTTGRPRDITYLDLAFTTYNARMAGIEKIAGTHIDIARAQDTIKVCTHYENRRHEYIPYQPGLAYQQNLIPQYVELPGWDGEACRRAKRPSDLPKNALRCLAFIQARTGFPIVAATTGELRDNIVTFPGYDR